MEGDPFLVCSYGLPGLRGSVLMSPYKDTHHMREGSILMMLLHFKYPFKEFFYNAAAL